jgi:thioredoxin 2
MNQSGNNPFLLRCLACGTRNRIPAPRMGQTARCGKCGAPVDTREALGEQPVLVTDANFENLIRLSPIPVMVFAWAPWCSTCLKVAPQFDAFAAEARGRVRAGKLNVDANPGLAARFHILSVPFLFVFDNGQLAQSLRGGLSKHELMMLMARYI